MSRCGLPHYISADPKRWVWRRRFVQCSGDSFVQTSQICITSMNINGKTIDNE